MPCGSCLSWFVPPSLLMLSVMPASQSSDGSYPAYLQPLGNTSAQAVQQGDLDNILQRAFWEPAGAFCKYKILRHRVSGCGAVPEVVA